ncbi:MAG: PEP/pyruvate-binding domain-containing protein [Lentisphaeria bacterium]
MRKYTQRFADVLDLQANRHATEEFTTVANASPALPVELFASRDPEAEAHAAATGQPAAPHWLLTFEPLLGNDRFIADLREMLKTTEAAYNHPVDIEFTANFTTPHDWRINLLQCRPFQVSRELRDIPLPENVPPADVLLRTAGPVLGQGIVRELRRIVYVLPAAFAAMSMSDRHSVARLIGELNQLDPEPGGTLLAGPGRWGTQMPALGIPVAFAEIRNAGAICEVVAMHAGLIPEISLGTHFFNDLVEMQIVYLALVPGKPGHCLQEAALLAAPNHLAERLPHAARWANAVRVLDAADLRPGHRLLLHVDACRQQALIFLAPTAQP